MKTLNRQPLTVAIISCLLLAACNSGSSDTSDSSDATIDTTARYTYTIVDTGQISCYGNDGAVISCPVVGEALAGQDAQHSGNTFDLTDNGDSTVTDNVTGLTWQQMPDNSGLSWQEAVDNCTNLELGGKNDWHIPTTKELFSISNFSEGWPYLDTTYFDLSGTDVGKDEQYWADYYVGTTVEGGSEAAFGVNHGTGHIKAYPAGISGLMGNYVRCVRGDTYGINYFVDNGAGGIRFDTKYEGGKLGEGGERYYNYVRLVRDTQ